jgi:hypothetical protein
MTVQSPPAGSLTIGARSRRVTLYGLVNVAQADLVVRAARSALKRTFRGLAVTHPGFHCDAGGCESAINALGEASMDVHQNARTTPHRREEIAARAQRREGACEIAPALEICESTVRKWLRRSLRGAARQPSTCG